MRSEAIVVTGSCGGIGRALVQTLRDAGMRVIGIDRQPGNDDEGYRHVRFEIGDLIDSDQSRSDLASRIDLARSELGADVITGLVNNAAVQDLAPAIAIPPDVFRRSLDVNVAAPLILAQMLYEQLVRSAGCIVNISSIHSEQTKAGFCAYSVSKAALSALSRALAVEWGAQIRIVTIEPAAISTPMLEAGFAGRADLRAKLDAVHPSGKIGLPTQVARWVCQSIQDGDAYSNGTLIRLDGGIRYRLFDPTDTG